MQEHQCKLSLVGHQYGRYLYTSEDLLEDLTEESLPYRLFVQMHGEDGCVLPHDHAETEFFTGEWYEGVFGSQRHLAVVGGRTLHGREGAFSHRGWISGKTREPVHIDKNNQSNGALAIGTHHLFSASSTGRLVRILHNFSVQPQRKGTFFALPLPQGEEYTFYSAENIDDLPEVQGDVRYIALQ